MSKPTEYQDKFPDLDYKCCDICMESFGTHEMTYTANEDGLWLCTRCFEEYELRL